MKSPSNIIHIENVLLNSIYKKNQRGSDYAAIEDLSHRRVASHCSNVKELSTIARLFTSRQFRDRLDTLDHMTSFARPLFQLSRKNCDMLENHRQSAKTVSRSEDVYSSSLNLQRKPLLAFFSLFIENEPNAAAFYGETDRNTRPTRHGAH